MLLPETRVALLLQLVDAGISFAEIASFVNPEVVPQMAGAEEVALASPQGVECAGLVLNERGYERLAQTPLQRVHFVVAATESFGKRNARAGVEEAVERFRKVAARADETNRYVSCAIAVAFGCPFEGAVDEGRVVELAAALVAAGADEINLADTIGVAVPGQVRRLVARARLLGRPVGIHLHNTRNTGLANLHVALDEGVETIDASLGGSGGCPFAPGATGNIATEDVVFMLEREGVATGIDLDALIVAAHRLEALLGRPLPPGVAHAGGFPTKRRSNVDDDSNRRAVLRGV